MKIINSVANAVPGPHKVDLGNSDKIIVVEIVKTVCLVLIGVIEKYKELSKYDLRQSHRRHSSSLLVFSQTKSKATLDLLFIVRLCVVSINDSIFSSS
ncbi:unnamed protein product [Dovyalis caffra]|uniref:THUMP domain-containing protein n=1 Tax=Dovyalis caffra TaxID=77055 RepID=A0AAV1QSV7_9ROSI|nr:unnamed protein product [Dovyalis caffra]